MAVYHVLHGYTLPNGRNAANTYQVDSTQEIALICNTAHDAWDDNIMDKLSDEVTHTVTRVSSFDGTGFFELNNSTAGGDTNPACPPNVTYLVKKQLAGRSRGGRFFLPGVNESIVDDAGNLIGTKQAAINTAFTAWLLEMVTADVQPVAARATGAIIEKADITSLSCDSMVSTQRRRLR